PQQRVSGGASPPPAEAGPGTTTSAAPPPPAGPAGTGAGPGPAPLTSWISTSRLGAKSPPALVNVAWTSWRPGARPPTAADVAVPPASGTGSPTGAPSTRKRTPPVTVAGPGPAVATTA